MILNRRGEVVATNATARHEGALQVVFVNEELIAEFERWLSARRLLLFQMPFFGIGSDDDLPTYAVTVREGVL